MLSECQFDSVNNLTVEILVAASKCPVMPAGGRILLEGPSVNYDKSGPICLTAINAIYPWIMLARFDVKTSALDYDGENACYHGVCPCGDVKFDIRNLNE